MRHGLQTGLGIAGVVLLTVYNLQSFSPAQQLQPGPDPGMEQGKYVQNLNIKFIPKIMQSYSDNQRHGQ